MSLIEEMHNFAQMHASGIGLNTGRVFEEVVKIANQTLLKPGNRAIDIGAHNGFHLFPMADAVGPNG